MKTEYEKRISKLTNKFRIKRTISKDKSITIIINECPICDQRKKCTDMMTKSGEHHLCINRSTDTESVYIWMQHDKAKYKVSIGDRYGHLEVINNNGKNKHGQVWWLCKCDCGNESIVLGYNLPSGHTKSCGKC